MDATRSIKIFLLNLGFYVILTGNVFGQSVQVTPLKINRGNVNYRDYVISNDRAFCLSDSGKLVIWDLNKPDTLHFSNKVKSVYTAIAANKRNEVFVATKNGEVFKIDPQNLSVTLFLKEKYPIYWLCFDAEDRPLLIIKYAVYDPISHRHWNKFDNQPEGLTATKKSFIFFRKKLTQYFNIPQYTFVDKKGWWWMTATYGEFGSSLQVFDTQQRKIVDSHFKGMAQSGLLFPKSIFDGEDGDIYLTSGLQHFINSGEIYKINKNGEATKLYSDKSLFIGPGAYNKFDKNIYYATSGGFFKADVSHELFNPIPLFNPTLSWSREPMAIGVSMAVIKMSFVGNKLLFLTRNDGFGLYDGASLTMFK